MNIDDLTVGQARELAALFGQPQPAAPHPRVGQYCIVRCRNAGVHAGIVEHVDALRVTLRDSRRLWGWQAAKEHSLSGVARHGIDPDRSTIAGPLDVLDLTPSDVCEIIFATPNARNTIEGAPIHDEQ